MVTLGSVLKDVRETSRYRVKNELISGFLLAWVGWNHKQLIQIWLIDDEVKKIADMEALFINNNWWDGCFIPFGLTLLMIGILPFINIGIARFKNKYIVPLQVREEEEPKRLRIQAQNKILKLEKMYLKQSGYIQQAHDTNRDAHKIINNAQSEATKILNDAQSQKLLAKNMIKEAEKEKEKVESLRKSYQAFAPYT